MDARLGQHEILRTYDNVADVFTKQITRTILKRILPHLNFPVLNELCWE